MCRRLQVRPEPYLSSVVVELAAKPKMSRRLSPTRVPVRLSSPFPFVARRPAVARPPSWRGRRWSAAYHHPSTAGAGSPPCRCRRPAWAASPCCWATMQLAGVAMGRTLLCTTGPQRTVQFGPPRISTQWRLKMFPFSE
jgi:hypothetical protein